MPATKEQHSARPGFGLDSASAHLSGGDGGGDTAMETAGGAMYADFVVYCVLAALPSLLVCSDELDVPTMLAVGHFAQPKMGFDPDLYAGFVTRLRHLRLRW